MKKIESIHNPYIQHLIKLRKSKAYRKDKNLCLITGNKIVNDISTKNIFHSIITTNPSIQMKNKNIIVVTSNIMKKITGLPSPEIYAAEVYLPTEKEINNENFLLVLDQIKDPGNLGTIIRTAHGLKWDGIIITPNSVDPFNDKALRAAKGSTFCIPIFRKTTEEINKIITKKKYTPYIADIKGENISTCIFKTPLMLILSSESHGVDLWADTIKNKITIPIKKDLDSLNVAISGGILMYEMTKNRVAND